MKKLKHVFKERGIKAVFDDEWSVIKLDEHKYYKRLSGMGLRGVDFLAVHPEYGLALIEMKNYKKGKTSIPEDLDKKMLEKQKGTIRLIQVIIKYYERQMYFRVLRYIGWQYLYPRDWIIWLNAKRHIDRDNLFFLGIVDY